MEQFRCPFCRFVNFIQYRIHLFCQKRREKRAVEFWNSRAKDICVAIEMSENRDNLEFKWQQLVWQELLMWARLGKSVTEEEFLEICIRRGFDATQRNFLVAGLRYIGLW